MAHGLTNDEYFKGARVVARNNRPLVDDGIQRRIGWTSWWGNRPEYVSQTKARRYVPVLKRRG